MNLLSRPFSFLLLLPVALVAASSSLPAQSLFDIDFGGARSHPFDVLHVAVDVRFDEAGKEVIGSVMHRMRSLDPALHSLRLDAAESMKIGKVTVDGAPARFDHEKESLIIHLPSTRRYSDTFTVAIDYRVVPKKGLYFIRPDSLRPDRRRQIWTQGEAEDNRHWVPMYDYPNDQATSELKATVRGEWKVLSNGELQSVRKNSDGTATWHYALAKPHAGYLIMMAAGDYLVTRDTVNGIALSYWSYPDQPERVEPTFGRTPDMVRYFEGLLGMKFPWSSYAQIMIADFMYGGMENTTATTLNDYLLVDSIGRLDVNPDNTIAHEVAHQWFGDLVTNRSWGHLWLHESFATYLAARYLGHRYGEETFLKMMYDNGRTGLGTDDQEGRDPLSGGRGLTPNLYQRGSRVLHMLNQLVSEELFNRACRLFLERHAHGLVETNDLKIAFEDVSGLNLDWFFDQWVYKGGAPELIADWSYERDSVRLHVRQIQKRDSLTGLFQMPVPVEAHTSRGIVRDTFWLAKEEATYTMAAGEKPRFVIFDAGDVMLKRVRFERSEAELIAQLQAPRMIDRLLAVDALSDSTADLASTTRPAALLAAYRAERSEHVREEIVTAAAKFTGDAAEEVIRLALRDPVVDVREEAVEMSHAIADRDRRATLLEPLLRDSSRNVSMGAIEMMAATRPQGLEPYLRATMGITGRRGRLAQSWLNAVMNGRFTSLVDGVVAYTKPGNSRFTRAHAYSTLSRLDTTDAAVRSAIELGLLDESQLVFGSAVSAARVRLDDTMRAVVVRLRDQLEGERRSELSKLLDGEQASGSDTSR